MSRDQKVAVGMGLFAVIFTVGSWRLPRFALATGVIDAHIFPMALGIILLILSAVLFVQSAGKQPKERYLQGTNVPLLWKLMAAVLGYALLLSPLGFVVATTIFLIAAMFLLGVRKWSRLIPIGVVFSLAIYALFVFGLKVPLAQGILPF